MVSRNHFQKTKRTFCSSRFPLARLSSHRSIAARAFGCPLFSPELPRALLLESKHSLPRVCLAVRAKNTKPSLSSRLEAHNPARAETPTIHICCSSSSACEAFLCCLRQWHRTDLIFPFFSSSRIHVPLETCSNTVPSSASLPHQAKTKQGRTIGFRSQLLEATPQLRGAVAL